MSLELERHRFFDTQNTLEPVTVVHVHGFGVTKETDRRQQAIMSHLHDHNPTLAHVTPDMCDATADVLVKLPIEAQVETLENTLKSIEGPAVVAAHSQGTIAAAEVVARRSNELGIIGSVWMGPVVDTKREVERLECEAAVRSINTGGWQSLQYRLPEGVELEDIAHAVRYNPRDKAPIDIAMPRSYMQSLGDVAMRHLDNLHRIWTVPGATIITAGSEEVTDGTPEAIYRHVPDAIAYTEAIDPGRLHTIQGANHQFGGKHRQTIAEIMRARVPALRTVRSMGTQALSYAKYYSIPLET